MIETLLIVGTVALIMGNVISFSRRRKRFRDWLAKEEQELDNLED